MLLALNLAILSTAYKDLLMTKSPGLAELVFREQVQVIPSHGKQRE
jgi:hypothetical protein